MQNKNRILSLSMSLIAFTQAAFPQPSTPSQTQSQLNHINEKIGTLKKKLSGFKHQQTDMEQSLIKIDKQMDEMARKVHDLTQRIEKKQQQIQKGSVKIQELSQELELQQMELMNNVRLIFTLGLSNPIKSVFMVNRADALDHWLVLSQYVVQSRQNLMDKILKTRQALSKAQLGMEQELNTQAQLKQNLNQQQIQLNYIKQQQTQTVDHISRSIKTDEQTLGDYEKDKANLSALLQRLLAQSEMQIKPIPTPLSSARMPSPLQGKYSAVKPWNQGLIFFSPEGTPVNAVQSGRVVFSDWLKGYGLLLILDHGQGWMSLYGYNQSLYKHIGEQVKAGDQIATVGHSGGRREDGVYFEVRRQGKVVAAQSWLKTKRTPVQA